MYSVIKKRFCPLNKFIAKKRIFAAHPCTPVTRSKRANEKDTFFGDHAMIASTLLSPFELLSMTTKSMTMATDDNDNDDDNKVDDHSNANQYDNKGDDNGDRRQ